MKKTDHKKLSYIGLFFVVFIWGLNPLLTLDMYKYYSPTIRVCFSELILLAIYLILAGKHIKEFNFEYIKIGLPTGFFLSLANITQKIGLIYTTPAKYAFLENLSCISVPVIMFILIKKKPKISTIAASLVCLASAFVLNGVSFSGSSWGIGEILCGMSGLLFGFNIAGTGIYAKKLNTPLYLSVQSVVGFTTSLILSFVLNSVTLPDASGIYAPIEKIMFSFNPLHILYVVVVVLMVTALGWIIRTYALKHIDASIVSVITPFSAVVTGILSVLSGYDVLDANLIFGSLLGVAAILLSSFEDIISLFRRS